MYVCNYVCMYAICIEPSENVRKARKKAKGTNDILKFGYSSS